MNIGSVKLDNITIFAPLAGITNLPLRLLAKEAGCALVCSEMISAKGLVYNSAKTVMMLDSHPNEKPLSVQIFGTEPSVMADAAARVEASGADIIDINFGCSVKKVIKTGAGAALMKDPVRSAEILKAVRNNVKIPVTIKIRSGWDQTGDQALAIANIARDNGVNAVVVHPRSVKQGFQGKADWPLIARIKQQIEIPVIGNGDVVSPDDALRMQKETGCDAVMVGRGALGRPWIFSQILALINGDEIPVISHLIRFETMIRYLETSVTYLGEKRACFMMRSRLEWFVKGLPYSSKFRQSIKKIISKNEALERIRSYQKTLTNGFSQRT